MLEVLSCKTAKENDKMESLLFTLSVNLSDDKSLPSIYVSINLFIYLSIFLNMSIYIVLFLWTISNYIQHLFISLYLSFYLSSMYPPIYLYLSICLMFDDNETWHKLLYCKPLFSDRLFCIQPNCLQSFLHDFQYRVFHKNVPKF